MKTLENWRRKLDALSAEEALRVKAAFSIALVLGVLSSATLALRHFLQTVPPILLVAISFSIVAMFSAAATLYRRPQQITGRVILIVGLFSIVPGPAIMNGGISAPIVSLFLLLPILGAFLIGRRASAVLLAMIILFLSVSVYANQAGLLPDPVDGTSVEKEVGRLIVYIALSLFSFVIGLVYSYFRIQTQNATLKVEQLKALNALVVTYNHEINNPLTVAMMQLKLMSEERTFSAIRARKIADALHRIEEVTASIQKHSATKTFETTEYEGEIKMFKIS